MGLEVCTVRSQEPAGAGFSTPLTKTARPFHVHIHQSGDVGYSEREHGLGQGGPLQLIQSLEGLTTEGNLLTPLPAAGAMSPFLSYESTILVLGNKSPYSTNCQSRV